MELWTTEPGLQFYDGHMIDIPVPGLRGAHYGAPCGSCAWNRSVFPTAPIRPTFPSSILEPERFSRQSTEYPILGLERECRVAVNHRVGREKVKRMPVLDARALERDPDGMAFPADRPSATIPARAPIEPRLANRLRGCGLLKGASSFSASPSETGLLIP